MIDPQQATQLIQPINVTEIAIAVVTGFFGVLSIWLNGRKVGRADAAAATATGAASIAEKHASVAVQASLRPPFPQGGYDALAVAASLTGQSQYGEIGGVQSIAPSDVHSDPPPASSAPSSLALPVDRPTPKERPK